MKNAVFCDIETQFVGTPIWYSLTASTKINECCQYGGQDKSLPNSATVILQTTQIFAAW
jgi:hypothetical protein